MTQSLSLLPPLRLSGATILRDAVLQQRSVSLADGWFVRGALPAADLTGYLILPGIIDLAGPWLSACADRRNVNRNVAQALASAGKSAARAGVTTQFLRQRWGGSHPDAAPDLAEVVLSQTGALDGSADSSEILRCCVACDAAIAGRSRRRPPPRNPHQGPGTDLRVQLVVDLLATEQVPRLLSALTRWHPGGVILTEGAPSIPDPSDDRRRDIPRLLCRLAEALDCAGIVYASHGDTDGQVREYYSMMGAGLAMAPSSHAAAAVARAIGDPVVLGAGDLLMPELAGHPGWAMLRARLCDALMSEGESEALAAAVFRLVDLGVMDMARAWGLISARPAELMRLADRGTLDIGRRADLVVIDPRNRSVAGTISGGVLTFATRALAERLAPILPGLTTQPGIAAE